MNGLRFPAPVQTDLSFEVDEVHFYVDGALVQANWFAPLAEPLSTQRLTRSGVSVGRIHTLTVVAVPLIGAPVEIGNYRLLIRRLPVIPRVQFFPLVFRKRTHLVGFQLRGIQPRSRVMAWGRGFRSKSRNRPLPLRLVKRGKSSRTYRVPGGLGWRRGSQPHLVFSISPPEDSERHGYPVRGRIVTGILRTDRAEDTRVRRTDGWKRCSEELSRGRRPPRRVSCERL